MHVTGDPAAELESFAAVVDRFKAGEISEAEFRIARVPMGIYEQRESGTYMLRVRFPAGGVLAEHLRKLGQVAAEFGNGILHVTTRQEFQIHRVPLDSIMPALRSLSSAGLSCKGGGGNTVRNITACAKTGVCPNQLFDVAPYAVSVTERLLPDPISFQLPRKYKIAFSACGKDCSGATVHDAGFIARSQNGVEGFAVYVGGGMGGKSRISSLLHDFIPASDSFVVAEAIKRVFDKHGNRKNKHLARLRFVVEKLGMDEFRKIYEAELAAVRGENPASLEVRPFPVRASREAAGAIPEGALKSAFFAEWFKLNVSRQLQEGFYQVQIPLPLGDLSSEKASALADILAQHGDGNLYATQTQNVSLRWVTGRELPELQERLASIDLANPEVPVLRNLVACAGASTCRLGICLSRGLASALRRELMDGDLALESLGNLSINISGCPNSCGRHPIGNIGFSGATRRIEGKPVPYYAVQLGGRLQEGKTRFGTNVGAVPARNAPAFVRDLLSAWQKSPEASDFGAFVDNGGKEIAAGLIERHQQAPLSGQDSRFYFDWDASSPFSLAGRGSGECSAGVFDLIEVDLANAREALEAGRFYSAALSAARSLLITRGLQPKRDQESFELFQKHFVAEGLVDSSLGEVIAQGSQSASGQNPENTFAGAASDVTSLVASVRVLFENMDASLRLKPVGK